VYRAQDSSAAATVKQEEIKTGRDAIKRLHSEIEKVKQELKKLTKKRDNVCLGMRSKAYQLTHSFYAGVSRGRQDTTAGRAGKGTIRHSRSLEDKD